MKIRKHLGIAVPNTKVGKDGKSFSDLAMWVLQRTSNPRSVPFDEGYVRALLGQIKAQLKQRHVVLSSESFSIFERKEWEFLKSQLTQKRCLKLVVVHRRETQRLLSAPVKLCGFHDHET